MHIIKEVLDCMIVVVQQLWFAHQSSTIRNAAGIAVVKDGMTVEQGKA
jgi:ABC-type multidrug transport system fused ATPase/permease subunit